MPGCGGGKAAGGAFGGTCSIDRVDGCKRDCKNAIDVIGAAAVPDAACDEDDGDEDVTACGDAAFDEVGGRTGCPGDT